MANPQKENGFTPIAHEIMEHLCNLSLSDYESRIIHVIFRKTYGWDKKADIISLGQFSQMTKIKTQHIARTIKGLLQRNIIKVRYITPQSVEYSFQKDYDLWDKKSALDLIFEAQLLPNEVVPNQVVPAEVVPNQVVPNEDTGSPYSGNQVVPIQVDTIDNIQKKITIDNNTKEIIPVFILPDWVDKNIWDNFLEMRKKIKATPTEHAKNLLIKELEKLEKEGNNPNEVLNQSIMNNWRGLFALKNNGNGNGGNGHGGIGINRGNYKPIAGNEPAGAFDKFKDREKDMSEMSN